MRGTCGTQRRFGSCGQHAAVTLSKVLACTAQCACPQLRQAAAVCVFAGQAGDQEQQQLACTHLDHELRGWVHRGCCLPGAELLALAGQLAHEAQQLQLLLPVCDGQLRGFAQVSQEQAR